MYKAVVFVLVLAALVAFVAFESHVAAISKPHAAGDAGPWLAARRPRRRPAAAASPAREVRAAALRARAAAARADAAATRAAASGARRRRWRRARGARGVGRRRGVRGRRRAAGGGRRVVRGARRRRGRPAALVAGAAARGPAVRRRARYWAGGLPGDAALVASGRVPPATAPEAPRYLTFVPDLGGWNNVRLGLENALVIARSSGRILVLPPPQTYYLLDASERLGLEDLLPALVGSPDRAAVIAAAAFVEDAVPRLRREGRYARPAARGGGAPGPPPANATAFVRGCHPTRKAPDSCFGFYDWLEDAFGDGARKGREIPDFRGSYLGGFHSFGNGFAPNVGRECLAFGDPPEARLAAACGPRTAVDGTPRARIDGDALFGGPDAVLHVRSSGAATHHAAAVRANRAAALRGEAVKPIEQNALGRLLAPPCAYVVHGDAATANFYKRLVRDLVRPSERATCAALRVVRWLRGVRKRGGTFSSVHVRSTDFQYAEGRADWAVVSRALAPREPVFVATDDDTGAVAAPLERAGHAVFTLAPLVRAALGGTRPKRATHWPDKKVLDALKAVKRAEVGVVDALIAAEGRTFTGAWFSTFTGFIHRVRGYRGYADNSSFFSAAGRWAAFQGFEAPRTPLYMREWPAAWRNIDSDGDAAPYPGERVFDEIDPAEGYPTDAVPEGLLAPKLEACVLPQSMRYWRAPGSGAADARLLRDPEAVPRLAGDRFLTFVPDLGGWNNVRLSFENVLVLARSTGRTLVLPPPQTYYLLTNCKRNCVFGFDDFLPALLDVDDLDARVVDYADGCTPTHLAPDSCFPAYFWLEDAFGLPDHIPDVGQHSGVATHEHDKWRDKKVGQGGPQLEPARMGRLLAPWYAYVVHADPAVANFYKRLVRDVVRLDEPRVTCAAAGVVAWLRSAYGGAFASAHARRNEFQFKETNAQLGAVGRDVHGGSWFSTFTSFIHRLRGYGGFRDADSYFTAPDRWAAFQGFERIRSPLYMREWPMAWRGIDGDEEAAPLPGERVFEPGVAKDGYPTDHLPPAALLAAT
ncbi:hypothetical protein JL722_2743 [Aureococcus anophagefferens]|nr:hypothetical protein JL722_2743 [Aureococcus anophagefferens]